jgi:hypothetical protein
VKRAKELLEHTGAQDIGSAGEKRADFDATEKPHPRDASGVESDTVYRDTTVERKTY